MVIRASEDWVEDLSNTVANAFTQSFNISASRSRNPSSCTAIS